MTPGEIIKKLNDKHAIAIGESGDIAPVSFERFAVKYWPTIAAYITERELRVEKQKELIAQWQARYDNLQQMHRRRTDEEYEEVKAVCGQINKALNAKE
jgi:oligoribonuclease (3'-5' exoribonuclease)